MLIVRAGEPAEFPAAEIDEFVSLVAAGGEVTTHGLRDRVMRAEQIAFVQDQGAFLGVAGLKSPSRNHRSEVTEGSKTTLDDAAYPFELGWVFILPSARNRRLSLPLCAALMTAGNGRGVFATSRVGNQGMHSTLRRLGFKRVGAQWASKQNDDGLALFVKRATPQTSRAPAKAKRSVDRSRAARSRTYPESVWQAEILQIVLLLNPKYIKAIERAPVRDTDRGVTRQIDILLVDASGNIDVIEIKQPFGQSIVSAGQYRDNHIPLRELSGSVMQIEKYVCLVATLCASLSPRAASTSLCVDWI